MFWFEIRSVLCYSYEGRSCRSPQCHYVLASSGELALKHQAGEVRQLSELPKLSSRQISQRKIAELHRVLAEADPSHKPPAPKDDDEEKLLAWYVCYNNCGYAYSEIVVLADTKEAAVQCAKETGVEPYKSACDNTCEVKPCDLGKVVKITPEYFAELENENRRRLIEYDTFELQELEREAARMHSDLIAHQKKIDELAAQLKLKKSLETVEYKK